MSDLISRNAVIAKLNTMDRYTAEELTFCDTDRKFPKNEVFIVDDVYEEIAEQLPSAQPERKKGDWIDFSMSIKGVPTECCGECGSWSLDMGKNYCPCCGADMRGERGEWNDVDN